MEENFWNATLWCGKDAEFVSPGLEVFLEVFTSTRAFLGSYPVKGAQDQEAIMYNVGDGSLVGKVEPELELLTQM